MVPDIGISVTEVILVIFGVVMLLIVLPVLIPMTICGFAGFKIQGSTIQEVLKTGAIFGGLGLAIDILGAIFVGVSSVEVPWSIEFDTVSDAWKVLLAPNLWLAAVLGLVGVLRLWRRHVASNIALKNKPYSRNISIASAVTETDPVPSG